MMGFKKKLTSLLPADARNQLQNALTVEWEGQGKTVLVDLPTTSGSRFGSGSNAGYDNELEMLGLTGGASGPGSGGAAYGRLADDEDDDIYSNSNGRSHRQDFNYDDHPSSSSKHQKHPSYSSKTLPPLPPRGTNDLPSLPHQQEYNNHSKSSGSGSNQPGFAGGRNLNPFEPEYHSPQPSSSSTYSSHSQSQSPYTGFTPTFGSQSQFHSQPNSHSQFSSQVQSHSQTQTQSYYQGQGQGQYQGEESVYGGGSTNGRIGNGRAVGNPWGKYRADDIDFLGDVSGGSRGGEDNRNPFA